MTAPKIDDFELPGYNPPTGLASWPPAARRAVQYGLGCSALVVLEFAVIWAVVTVMFSARTPEGLLVKAAVPEAAAVGATMPLTLTIRNEGDRPFTVRSLAARGTTLRAFRLEKPVPAPTRGTLNVWGSTVWSYEQPVEPGKSWSVRFDATPLKSGTVRGVVEAQVNTGMRSAPFTIEVEHQAGKEPAKSPPPAIRR